MSTPLLSATSKVRYKTHGEEIADRIENFLAAHA